MQRVCASWLLASAIACAACNKTNDTVVADVAPPPAVDAGANTSAPGTRMDAGPQRSPVWSLPRIKSGEALSPARFRLAIDGQSLLLDSQKVLPLPADPSHGFDAEYKRSGKNDLMLTPLADAVKRARAETSADTGSGARLELGPKVTYRLLTEILFTLGQSEVTTFAIVAPSGGGAVPVGELAEIRTVPPKGHAALLTPPLGLLIIVTQDGIGLKARGGQVAPGCSDVGPGLTFQNQGAGYRLAELGPCLVKLKAGAPGLAEEKTVTFTAVPSVGLPDVLAVLDVARGENRELFPDVMFGMAR